MNKTNKIPRLEFTEIRESGEMEEMEHNHTRWFIVWNIIYLKSSFFSNSTIPSTFFKFLFVE